MKKYLLGSVFLLASVASNAAVNTPTGVRAEQGSGCGQATVFVYWKYDSNVDSVIVDRSVNGAAWERANGGKDVAEKNAAFADNALPKNATTVAYRLRARRTRAPASVSASYSSSVTVKLKPTSECNGSFSTPGGSGTPTKKGRPRTI